MTITEVIRQGLMNKDQRTIDFVMMFIQDIRVCSVDEYTINELASILRDAKIFADPHKG